MTTQDVTRCLPFEIRSAQEDVDGLTMTGYAAVFNQTARIDTWEGQFDEVIRPGAFRDSLRERTPALMFDHGNHPLIGNIPIGRYSDVHEDDNGLHVTARFHNNWLTEPIRDAIRDGSVTGMSVRWFTDDVQDKWTRRSGKVPFREIMKATVPEMGPVVFPAYAGTDVAVRSLGAALRGLDLPPEELTDLLGLAQPIATPDDDLTGRPSAERAGGGDAVPDPDDSESAPVNPESAARYRALKLIGAIPS